MLAVIGTDFAFERLDRAGLGAEGLVKPALDGGHPEHHPFSGNGVAPLFGGQFLESPLQFPAAGRRRQQRSDHAEAKMRPVLMGPRLGRRFFDRMRHFYFFHLGGGAGEGSTTGGYPVSPGILCGNRNRPQLTNSFQAVGVVIGARNRSKSSSRSRRSSTAKLRHNDNGSVFGHKGGMNRARASLQNELPTKRPSHH